MVYFSQLWVRKRPRWVGSYHLRILRAQLNKITKLSQQGDSVSVGPTMQSHSTSYDASTSMTVKQPLKRLRCESPSVSQTLGNEDTSLEFSIEEPQGSVTSKPMEDKINASWVNLFKNNRNTDDYFQLHLVKDQADVITSNADDVDDVEESWGYCLVSYFASCFPGKTTLLLMCNLWKVECQRFVHKSGWLIFKFKDEATRASVLHGGPYFVFERPLMLKVMPRCAILILMIRR